MLSVVPVSNSQADAVDSSGADRQHVVMGIHGLENKPSAAQPSQRWKLALDEGFRRDGRAIPDYKFEPAYWPDVLNSQPVVPVDQDEPYMPASGEGRLPSYEGGALDSFRGSIREWGSRALD